MPRKSNPMAKAMAEAMKDPLVAAVVDKMPIPNEDRHGPKTVWPKRKRTEWLKLFDLAFDQIYDDAPPADIASGVSIAAAPAGAKKYWIDPNGVAYADDKMIDPHQIPPGTIMLDYRQSAACGKWDDQDDPIMWLTSGAKVMRAPPAVKLRPTEGPLPSFEKGSGLANGSGEEAGASP